MKTTIYKAAALTGLTPTFIRKHMQNGRIDRFAVGPQSSDGVDTYQLVRYLRKAGEYIPGDAGMVPFRGVAELRLCLPIDHALYYLKERRLHPILKTPTDDYDEDCYVVAKSVEAFFKDDACVRGLRALQDEWARQRGLT